MELDEVAGRIFRRHRALILVLVLLGALGGLLAHWQEQQLYAGSARITLGGSDVSSANQATSLADTARALATGTGLVQHALADVGSSRDAATVAQDSIQVQSIGSSGIVQITVTDPDPQVAIALTNAVAKGVVAARAATDDTNTQLLKSIAARIDATQAQIAALDKQAAGLADATASVDVAVSGPARAQLDLLTQQRAQLATRLGVLQTQQADVQSAQAGLAAPALTDAAAAPATPVPTRRVLDILLGALLGLVLGTALAAVIESLRPSVVGRTAIARAIGAPVLADLGDRLDAWDDATVAEAAMHVEMAAVGANVRRVELMGVGGRGDLGPLAEAIGAANPRIAVSHIDTKTVRRLSADQGSMSARHQTGRDLTGRHGLVVVVPASVRLADLDEVRNFRSISGWPLLGVIVAHRRGGHSTAPVDSEPAARTEASA